MAGSEKVKEISREVSSSVKENGSEVVVLSEVSGRLVRKSRITEV